MKAIQTRYAGCWFRSRLEARWAVFYDALGIEWRYEPEGFDLGDAGWYLPDFYLPEHRTWIEIKPEPPSWLDKTKALALFEQPTGKEYSDDVFIFFGDIPWPYPKAANATPAFLFKYEPSYCWKECPLCGNIHIGEINLMSCNRGCDTKTHDTLISSVQNLIGERDENVMRDVRTHLFRAMNNIEFFSAGHKSERLKNAYESGRSARFERNHIRPVD